MSDNSYRSSSRVVIGVAVMALGVLFTLDNLGAVQARAVLHWWPVLLVFYGLARLMGLGNARPRPISGTLFVLVGSWWLLHNLGVVNRGVFDFWPLLLVFLGVAIIRRGYWGYRNLKFGYIGRDARRFGQWPPNAGGADKDAHISYTWGTRPAPPVESTPFEPATAAGAAAAAEASGAAGGAGAGAGAAPESAPRADQGPAPAGQAPPASDAYDPSAVLRVDVFMSSVSRKVASQRFRGGEVVAIMGGGDIDLRSARMEGEVARLEINLVMGGVNLLVPEDWVVEYQGTPIMGGVEDTSRRPVGSPRGRLVITGALLWSAIVIKN